MANTLQTPPTHEPRLAHYNAQRIGFTSGVVAAVVMLVAIVLLRVLSGVLSLPEIVAEGLLVNMPGALFSAVLDALQHAAKPLFYVAVAVGMLIVGGVIGRFYARQPTWQQAAKIIVVAWLAVGLVVHTL